MLSYKKLYVVYAILCLYSSACHHSKKTTTSVIQGLVIDDTTQLPIAGSQVTLVSANISTHTDSNGAFSLTYHTPYSGLQSVKVEASGYAPVIRVYGELAANVVFALKQFDLSQTIILNNETTTVAIEQALGQTTLSIPPNSLVDSQGNIATGQALINMAFWPEGHPEASAPGPLLASTSTPQGTPIMLESYGMASIEISQNGNLLQIANGQYLLWNIQIGSQAMNRVASFAPGSSQIPALYHLNPNTGLWDLAGMQGPQVLTYDTTQGLFTAYLPHLSGWNVDGQISGGCVTGQIINTACSGNNPPAKNTPVTINLLGWEQLVQIKTISDKNGAYCVNTGHTTYSTDSYTVSQQINYKEDICGAKFPQQPVGTNLAANYVYYCLNANNKTNDPTSCNTLPPACMKGWQYNCLKGLGIDKLLPTQSPNNPVTQVCQNSGCRFEIDYNVNSNTSDSSTDPYYINNPDDPSNNGPFQYCGTYAPLVTTKKYPSYVCDPKTPNGISSDGDFKTCLNHQEYPFTLIPYCSFCPGTPLSASDQKLCPQISTCETLQTIYVYDPSACSSTTGGSTTGGSTTGGSTTGSRVTGGTTGSATTGGTTGSATTGGTTPPNNACTSLAEGDPCDPATPNSCCSPTLVCLDQICVPLQD